MAHLKNFVNYQERIFAFELTQLDVDNPLPLALVHQSGKFIFRVRPRPVVTAEATRVGQTLQLAVTHRVSGRLVRHRVARVSGSWAASFPGATKDSENVDVARGDEIVFLLLTTLLVVVVLDESVAEGLAILVVERVSVPLDLATT